MLGIKLRAGLLGVLALLLLGSLVPAVASAEGGPFWHHRGKGEGGNGVKIEKGSPEKVEGKGGEQKLKTKLGEALEITSSSVEVKGTIYNNGLQAQSNLELTYIEPKITTPESAKGCEVKVGSNNVVKVHGDAAWKYKGNAEELTGKPQRKFQGIEWIFLPSERVQGETAEEGKGSQFTTITIEGSKVCPTTLHEKQGPVKGSLMGEGQPGGLEEWSTEQTIKTPEGEFWQHYWNGEKFVPWKTGLFFVNEKANLVGTTKVTTASQEVALFEG